MARRIMQRLTQTLATLALVALSVLGGGAAFAYWAATGNGTATSTTGTNTAVILTPGTAPTGLYPGGAVNVALSVSNPNTSVAFIGSLALDTTQGTSGFAVDAGHPGCTPAALTYTTATNSGAGWSVPAKAGAVNGTLAVTLTNALSMGAAAANACQGASFTVYLAAGP
jgi:hypothetical protein